MEKGKNLSQSRMRQLPPPPIPPPPVSLTLNWENMLFVWMIWFETCFFSYTFCAIGSQFYQVLEYFHVKIVMKVFTCSSFRIKRSTRRCKSLCTFAEYVSFEMRVILFSSGLRGYHSFVYLVERLNVTAS